jgi:predicted DNA-binding transcriptional regulator AlpA
MKNTKSGNPPLGIITPLHRKKEEEKPTTRPTIQGFDALSDSAFLRLSQLVQSPKRCNSMGLLPFSAPTLWRKVKAGTFPQPLKIAPRVTCWRVGDIRAWLLQQTRGQT